MANYSLKHHHVHQTELSKCDSNPVVICHSAKLPTLPPLFSPCVEIGYLSVEIHIPFLII